MKPYLCDSPRKPRQTLRQFRELQRLAANVIMRPLGPGMRTLRIWTDGRRTQDVASGFIKPNDRLSSLERIEIYNRQYWFRLIDILYDDFPGLRAVLGPSKFDRLIRAYLAACPSRSYTLRNLGSRLPQFLLDHPQYATPRRQMAIDMAHFEWAQTVAFDGQALPPLTVDDLLGADPDKLRLSLQPYLTLLDLHYPLDDFSIALKRHELRNDASNAINETSPRQLTRRPRLPHPKRTFVAVHRHDNSLYYKRLDTDGFVLLTALRVGKTLTHACAAAIDAMPPHSSDPAQRIQSLFKTWAALGWFCRRR